MMASNQGRSRSVQRLMTWRIYNPWKPRDDYGRWPLSQIEPTERDDHLRRYCKGRYFQGMVMAWGLLLTSLGLAWAFYLLVGSRYHTWEFIPNEALVTGGLPMLGYAIFWNRRAGPKGRPWRDRVIGEVAAKEKAEGTNWAHEVCLAHPWKPRPLPSTDEADPASPPSATG